jgi:SAM-dependent methyltransferase
MRYLPFDWYETPTYYDIVFDADTQREAAFLDEVYDDHASPPRRRRPRVLEPACGSGRLLKAMKERGWRVEGFDLSDGMIAAARRRLPRGKITKQAMQDFAVEPGVDLAFNLVSSFKHVLTEEGARGHLRCMANVLRKGGLYVLGIHESEYGVDHKKRERWVAERDGVHVVCNIQVWPPHRRKRVEKVRSRLVVTEGGERRGYESHWDFRTYDAGQIKRLLRSEPRLDHLATYGFEHRLDSRHEIGGERLDHVIVLRRR